MNDLNNLGIAPPSDPNNEPEPAPTAEPTAPVEPLVSSTGETLEPAPKDLPAATSSVPTPEVTNPSVHPAQALEPVKDTPPAPQETTSTAITSPSPTPAPSNPTPSNSTPSNPAADAHKANLDKLFSRMAPVGSKSSFKLLIYGPPGGTKSSFLDIPNNLIYDQENGLISMKSRAIKTGRQVSPNVQGIPFTSFVQADMLLDALIKNEEQVSSFEVFSIDTFNDFHKKSLMEIVAKYHANAPQSVNKWVPETEHHQENNERMMDYVRRLRSLDRDLILTAHSKTVEPKGRPAKTYPDFSEALANRISAMMDVVGYMEMREIDGEQHPVLRLSSEGNIVAKSRVNLPAEIVDPTYAKIRAAWEEVRDA